jgi:Tfp pilus assembly protein PilF
MNKKQVITIVAAVATTLTFAQNSKVVSAYNYLKYDELRNAKTAIDAASINTSTLNKAKTWYYKGKVYQALFESKEEKFNTLHENPIQVAFDSYTKALSMPDVKKIDIADLQRLYAVVGNHMVNKGIEQFKASDFASAMTSFEAGISVGNHFKSVDSLSYYYAAVSASRANQEEKATTYFKKCVEIGYEGPMAYYYLAEILLKKDDKAGFKTTIAEGRKAYPDDANLLTQQINIYLEEGDAEGALSALNLAIEKDSTNKTLYYARGNMFEKRAEMDSLNSKSHIENAKADYNKSIELDGTYFDAYYNMGAMIYNQAIAYMMLVNEIKDNTKYANEKVIADEIFKSSLPFLEKAHELNAADRSTMMSLKELYGKTNNTAKWQEFKDKLEK